MRLSLATLCRRNGWGGVVLAEVERGGVTCVGTCGLATGDVAGDSTAVGSWAADDSDASSSSSLVLENKSVLLTLPALGGVGGMFSWDANNRLLDGTGTDILSANWLMTSLCRAISRAMKAFCWDSSRIRWLRTYTSSSVVWSFLLMPANFSMICFSNQLLPLITFLRHSTQLTTCASCSWMDWTSGSDCPQYARGTAMLSIMSTLYPTLWNPFRHPGQILRSGKDSTSSWL